MALWMKLEDLTVIGGLVAVQFTYAGIAILLNYAISVGLSVLSVAIIASFGNFVVVSPLAVSCERSKWPSRVSFKLMTLLVLLAFGGVMNQEFFMNGIKRTSPALATAMPNVTPALVFVISWILGYEKVKLSCTYNRLKIVGTLLCVVGAMMTSLMHCLTKPKGEVLLAPSVDALFDEEKIIGCIYLSAGVLVVASTIILQARTLVDLPAPISLCAVISLMTAVLAALIQLLLDHKLDIGWPRLSVWELIGYALLSGACNGGCISFNGWAMKKRGPVLVSMFSPIATVVSVIISVFTLGIPINLGSLAGIFIMFTGLYSVVWAKSKENYEDEGALAGEFDAKKPLLS